MILTWCFIHPICEASPSTNCLQLRLAVARALVAVLYLYVPEIAFAKLRHFPPCPILRPVTPSYALPLANISLQVGGLGSVKLSLARQSDSARSCLQAGEARLRERVREERSSGRGRRGGGWGRDGHLRPCIVIN